MKTKHLHWAFDRWGEIIDAHWDTVLRHVPGDYVKKGDFLFLKCLAYRLQKIACCGAPPLKGWETEHDKEPESPHWYLYRMADCFKASWPNSGDVQDMSKPYIQSEIIRTFGCRHPRILNQTVADFWIVNEVQRGD